MVQNVDNKAFARQQEQKRSQGLKLIETYSKDSRLDGYGEKLLAIANKNEYKGRLIAERVAMQDVVNKSLLESGMLTETTFSNTFGLTPEYVLKASLIGTALSNRPNWMREVTLNTMNDVYWYIDKIRNNTLRTATAGDKLLETENTYYSTERNYENIGTGNGATTNFTATLAQIPVGYTLNIITIDTTGKQLIVARDNNDAAAGTFTSNGVLSAGTITYATRALDITFATAPATGVQIKMEYHYNSEDPANYASYNGTVSLVTRNAKFRPRPKTVGVSYTDMSMLMYDNAFKRSLQDDLLVAQAEEMASSRDYEGVQFYVRMANKNTLVEFDAQFSNFGEMSDELHAQKVWDRIELAEAQVNETYKRGGNFNRIICGKKAAIYLKKDKNFDRSGAQDRTAGSWFIGKRGKVEVYETIASSSRLAEDEALLINYSPEDTTEPCAVAGVMAELDASLRYPDFHTESNTARVEDIVEINSAFVNKLKINNIDFSLAL